MPLLAPLMMMCFPFTKLFFFDFEMHCKEWKESERKSFFSGLFFIQTKNCIVPLVLPYSFSSFYWVTYCILNNNVTAKELHRQLHNDVMWYGACMHGSCCYYDCCLEEKLHCKLWMHYVCSFWKDAFQLVRGIFGFFLRNNARDSLEQHTVTPVYHHLV